MQPDLQFYGLILVGVVLWLGSHVIEFLGAE